jgi:hypothetical protein
MKKVYNTPVVNVVNIESPAQLLAQSDDWVNSKKFSGNKFGSNSGSSFQSDGTFGGQKSPWEEND